MKTWIPTRRPHALSSMIPWKIAVSPKKEKPPATDEKLRDAVVDATANGGERTECGGYARTEHKLTDAGNLLRRERERRRKASKLNDVKKPRDEDLREDDDDPEVPFPTEADNDDDDPEVPLPSEAERYENKLNRRNHWNKVMNEQEERTKEPIEREGGKFVDKVELNDRKKVRFWAWKEVGDESDENGKTHSEANTDTTEDLRNMDLGSGVRTLEPLEDNATPYGQARRTGRPKREWPGDT